MGGIIGQLHRIQTQYIRKPLRIKLYHHGRAQNNTVILHIFRDAGILVQLIVQYIGKSRQRFMILKKRIYVNHQCCHSQKADSGNNAENRKPSFFTAVHDSLISCRHSRRLKPKAVTSSGIPVSDTSSNKLSTVLILHRTSHNKV